jgi:hypothetical protein
MPFDSGCVTMTGHMDLVLSFFSVWETRDIGTPSVQRWVEPIFETHHLKMSPSSLVGNLLAAPVLAMSVFLYVYTIEVL